MLLRGSNSRSHQDSWHLAAIFFPRRSISGKLVWGLVWQSPLEKGREGLADTFHKSERRPALNCLQFDTLIGDFRRLHIRTWHGEAVPASRFLKREGVSPLLSRPRRPVMAAIMGG